MSRPPRAAPTIPKVLDDEPASHGQPLDFLAAANAREFVLVTAQQEKAVKLPAVRLEENRLEALDIALLLEPGIIFESFVEHLGGLSFTASHGNAETDEKPGICHDPPLCQSRGHYQARNPPAPTWFSPMITAGAFGNASVKSCDVRRRHSHSRPSACRLQKLWRSRGGAVARGRRTRPDPQVMPSDHSGASRIRKRLVCDTPDRRRCARSRPFPRAGCCHAE